MKNFQSRRHANFNTSSMNFLARRRITPRWTPLCPSGHLGVGTNEFRKMEKNNSWFYFFWFTAFPSGTGRRRGIEIFPSAAKKEKIIKSFCWAGFWPALVRRNFPFFFSMNLLCAFRRSERRSIRPCSRRKKGPSRTSQKPEERKLFWR